MRKRYMIRGTLVALAMLAGMLASHVIWAAETAPRACQTHDLVVTDPLLPHQGIVEGRAARLSHYLQRMYCAAQQIMAEPTVKRRLPYEAIRQRATRSSEELVKQFQLVLVLEAESALDAFSQAFRNFYRLNTTIASEAVVAETPAEQDAVRALAADQGEAAYTRVHEALKTFVTTLSSPAVSGAANQAVAATPDYWPTSGWRLSTPAQQGMDTERLADMVASIRNEAYDIDNVTLIRNGYLVLDVYRHPFQKGMTHYLHSCTKSVMSALIGIALDRGDLESVHQPILEFFPNHAIANVDVRKRAMTVEHLLTMTTGLACRDSYLYNWNGLKDMAQSDNWAHFVADLPMLEPPGERFEYCNGASYLLSVILQQATRMHALDFAKAHLFGPLGITDIQWRSSPQGVNIGWGDMWLTPHDMAKFGWLYLNQGRWEGRQVVSAAWVAASTRGLIRAELFPGYGYQWWSDRVHYWSSSTQQRVDYYFALGYKGQYIFVVPSKQLVAVFTGNLEGDAYFIPQRLLHDDIIPAVISSEPLPAAPQQQTRLEALVRELGRAPDTGYTWGQAVEGTARDGTFVRRMAPAFQFDYPAGSRKSDLELLPHQVMSMTTLEGMPIFASVGDVPAGLTLSDIGPKFYVPFLSGVGSEVQIVSNRPITLRDGTSAYRSDIRWRHPEGGPLTGCDRSLPRCLCC